MNVLFVLQHPGPVDGGDLYFIPLDVMHIILVDSELGAGEGDTGHLILQGSDVESSWDDVVEEQLWVKLVFVVRC